MLEARCNVTPVTGRRDPKRCEASRSPYLFATRRQPTAPNIQKDLLVLISVRGSVNRTIIIHLRALCKTEKSSDPSHNRTCDLPTCSIVPQQITLQREPVTLRHDYRIRPKILNKIPVCTAATSLQLSFEPRTFQQLVGRLARIKYTCPNLTEMFI
jgi:hypothetical protein